MTSIKDIDFIDIRDFLINNDIAVPRHRSKDELYEQAEKMIKAGKYQYIPNNIIDWIIAKNFLDDGFEIKTYKQSEIETLSDQRLADLYAFLSNGEEINNKDLIRKSVLNILKFLHKLQLDKSYLTKLNVDPFVKILENLNADQIYNLCNSSTEFKKNCNSSYVRSFLINRISAEDNMDLADFSNEDLIKYYQILPYKKNYMVLTPYPPNLYIRFGGYNIYVGDNYINQIIKINEEYAVVLTIKGKLELLDLISGELIDTFVINNLMTNKSERVKFHQKFWAIFRADVDFIALDSAGNYYYFDTNYIPYGTFNEIRLLPKNPDAIRSYLSGKYNIGKKLDPLSRSYYISSQ